MMYNTDTEILFPSRVIPTLRDLRGDVWHDLVDQVLYQEETAVDRLAFVLVMTRLAACPSCHADSFRALRGCTRCANQAVRHYRGSDQDIVKLFMGARQELQQYLGMG
jgi:hypothetical protein